MNRPPDREDIRIGAKKSRCRQTEFRIPAFGPRITEIDKDSCNLPTGKHLTQMHRVSIDKAHIFKACILHPLHCHHHGTLHLFNGKKQHIPVCSSGISRKAPFPAADFKPYLPVVRKGGSPDATFILRV